MWNNFFILHLKVMDQAPIAKIYVTGNFFMLQLTNINTKKNKEFIILFNKILQTLH